MVSDALSRLNELDKVLDTIKAGRQSKFQERTTLNSAPMMFRKTLAALTGDTFSLRPPISGTIVECFIDFPTGCRKLVEVKVSKNANDLVPINDFIALDKPYKTPLREKITPNDTITVEINNHDENNPHTVTVLLSIIGET